MVQKDENHCSTASLSGGAGDSSVDVPNWLAIPPCCEGYHSARQHPARSAERM